MLCLGGRGAVRAAGGPNPKAVQLLAGAMMLLRCSGRRVTGSEGMAAWRRGQRIHGMAVHDPKGNTRLDKLKRFAHGMTILQTVPMKTRRRWTIVGEVPEFDLRQDRRQGARSR
jgi:hypothetical protein